jgi:hypothetical protein
MIELDKKLHKEIKEYCQMNGLIMKEYVNSLLKKAFVVDKFGETPFGNIEQKDVNNKKEEKSKERTLEKSSNIDAPTLERVQETLETGELVHMPSITDDTVKTVAIDPLKKEKKPKKRNL